LKTSLETTSQQREELDQQTSNLSRRIQSLEAQLIDAQELLQEETRQKLAAQSQARNLQSDLNNMKVIFMSLHPSIPSFSGPTRRTHRTAIEV
jgi:myosin protein heavy chain